MTERKTGSQGLHLNKDAVTKDSGHLPTMRNRKRLSSCHIPPGVMAFPLPEFHLPLQLYVPVFFLFKRPQLGLLAEAGPLPAGKRISSVGKELNLFLYPQVQWLGPANYTDKWDTVYLPFAKLSRHLFKNEL